MKRMVILYGGRSGEHEVSLVSAASILRHLDPLRFEPILVGASKEGEWYLQGADAVARALAAEGPLSIEAGPRVFAAPGRGLAVESVRGVESLPCDLVFPVLHGTFGEDGTIQGLLEIAGLAYVGAPVLGSAIGMDKEKAKELWLNAGLPVVPFIAVRRDALEELEALGEHSALARKIDARFGWPCFVKPACAGSSVGASKAQDAELLRAALRAALEWDEKVLVEPFVNAREIECAVLGNEAPVAFAPGEVIPSHEFYDYDAKYLDPEGARLELPARIASEQAERVKSVAVAAFKAAELAGMARVDFFIDKITGEVLLNEVNTIPGFTHISMYPRMCEAGGLPYPELITRLAELALERQVMRSKLKFMA
jgi:D-alanine-D-alanine ligase